jgi:hypothetical protein
MDDDLFFVDKAGDENNLSAGQKKNEKVVTKDEERLAASLFGMRVLC